MRHVDKQIRPDLVGNLAEAREVQGLRIGRETGDDHLRLVLHRQALDLVVVDQAVGVDAVLHSVVQLAGRADLGPVGQVAAVGQAHAQEGVAGLQQCQVYRGVGLGTRVWLDVGVPGAEQRLGAVDGQLFNHIDVLAATVITLARVAFGVFVGQLGALGLHHLRAGVVLRGDQLDMVFLALHLAADGSEQRRVEIGKGQASMEHVRVTFLFGLQARLKARPGAWPGLDHQASW
ncbi:hypothetical protein D9M71_510860 [compost metagenome]